MDDDDLHAELAMIDENLCRAELSAAERAQQTARRKAIYLEIHPETGHGKASPRKDDNLSSFAQATADAIGKSERSIQRDAARGEAIAPDVLDAIKHTALDTGTYLDRLKVVPIEHQRAKVQRALAQWRENEGTARKKNLEQNSHATRAEPPKRNECAQGDGHKQRAAATNWLVRFVSRSLETVVSSVRRIQKFVGPAIGRHWIVVHPMRTADIRCWSEPASGGCYEADRMQSRA